MTGRPDNKESTMERGEAVDTLDVESILRGGFLTLKFPKPLERAYRSDARDRASLAFRHRALLILIIYLLLSSGIYILLPTEERWRWFAWFGWVGVIIIATGLLSHLEHFNRHFYWHTGTGSLLAVAFSVAMTSVVQNEAANQLTHAAVMYSVIIVYAIVGLSLRVATVAAWCGGILGAVLATVIGEGINWDLIHRTYTGSSLLGMVICYLIEQADRRSWLQSLLLSRLYEQTSRHARKVEMLSRHDPLTGLANRRELDFFLKHHWRHAKRERQPLAALMVDIDHFKDYNDHCGHIKGDECLQGIAEILGALAKRPGDLAVRYGGEEFLVLLSNTDTKGADKVAQKLLAQVRSQAIPHPRTGSSLTISVGVAALIPTADLTPDSLLNLADAALYEAKDRGRACVVISQGVKANAS